MRNFLTSTSALVLAWVLPTIPPKLAAAISGLAVAAVVAAPAYAQEAPPGGGDDGDDDPDADDPDTDDPDTDNPDGDDGAGDDGAGDDGAGDDGAGDGGAGDDGAGDDGAGDDGAGDDGAGDDGAGDDGAGDDGAGDDGAGDDGAGDDGAGDNGAGDDDGAGDDGAGDDDDGGDDGAGDDDAGDDGAGDDDDGGDDGAGDGGAGDDDDGGDDGAGDDDDGAGDDGAGDDGAGDDGAGDDGAGDDDDGGDDGAGDDDDAGDDGAGDDDDGAGDDGAGDDGAGDDGAGDDGAGDDGAGDDGAGDDNGDGDGGDDDGDGDETVSDTDGVVDDVDNERDNEPADQSDDNDNGAVEVAANDPDDIAALSDSDDDQNGGGNPNNRSNRDDTGGAGVRGVPSGGDGNPRDPDDIRNLDGDSLASDDERGTVVLDRDGFAARAGEVLAFDLDASQLSVIRELGFRVIESRRLDGLGATLSRLAPPPDIGFRALIDRLRETVPAAPFDYNHLFVLPEADGAKAGIGQIRLGSNGGGAGATIAMIDTAIDLSHPSLRGRSILAQDFARPGGGRDTTHGTAVASILVGMDDGNDYAGLVPGARLLAANVFRVNSRGEAQTDANAILSALDWAAKSGAGVINISIAGPPSQLLEQAIARLSKKGHIIVAAVGNDGPAAPPLFPAAYPEVIGVTAVDLGGSVFRRAGRGDHVDIAAPGVAVRAALPGGAYGSVTGTSFATPVVAGLLALSVPRPDPTLAAQAQTLLRNARDLGAAGPDQTFGAGLVQAAGIPSIGGK